MIVLTLLLSCSWFDKAAPPRSGQPPEERVMEAFAFARQPDGARLTLPPSSRPPGEGISDTFHPTAPLARRGQSPGGPQTWLTPLPVHPNLFPNRQAGARAFGFYAPADLEVRYRGRPLRFERNAATPDTWAYTHDNLQIGLAGDATPPTPADIEIRWPRAAQVERTMNLDTSGLSPTEFALRNLVLDRQGMTGLLLPAPATAEWDVDVPRGGVLTFRADLLPPALAGTGTTDGATVRVSFTVDGETFQVGKPAVLDRVGASMDWRGDLSAWAGKRGAVRFTVDPGPSSAWDLVFLEEPTLYQPDKHPHRIVVCFLDTVRSDHLGMYGYARPTTPKLDAWARGALRFDDHRTVAPWTLPSTRAAFTGAQPEYWYETDNLAVRLARAGYYTDGIVANGFLSPTFDMHRGFARYNYQHLEQATQLVDHAAEVLQRWPDRNLLLYVQFMSAHLPYAEPEAYRGLFAGPRPAGLKEVARTDLLAIKPANPEFAAIRQHVIDRYDQNIRYLDDEVSRLIGMLPDDATVVLFADHGEEFWDHGGYEHGHSFHDELMKVPMVIQDPHLPNGAFEHPSSLLDLTPTLLHVAGLPHDAPAGRSLVPAALGQADEIAALKGRGQAFGRPLYGPEGWGVVWGDHKWWSRSGDEVHYDLLADADEASPSPDPFPGPERTREALGQQLHQVWRVELTQFRYAGPVVLRFSHPAGIRGAWIAYDPRGLSEGIAPVLEGGVVTLSLKAGRDAPPRIFLLPAGDPLQASGLTVQIDTGSPTQVVYEGPALVDGAQDRPFLGWTPAPTRLGVGLSWSPEPFGRQVGGSMRGMEAELKELGYTDP